MTAIPPEFNLQSYDFDLPEAQVAQDPTEKRGASRLLVLDRASGELRDAMFAEIAQLHGGRASLGNRDGGGAVATVGLPLR